MTTLGYIGDINVLSGQARFDQLARFFVDNPQRAKRPTSIPSKKCGLCLQRSANVDCIKFNEEDYFVCPNGWPMVLDQLLWGPTDHREELSSCDVLFMLETVRRGASHHGIHYGPGEALLFVNATQGSGRSQPHFHWHSTLSAHVPQPAFSIKEWPICSADGLGRLHLVDGLPYCALQLVGTDQEIADFTERLGAFFALEEVAYNLFIRAAPLSPSPAVVLIPRRAEYAEAVDQKVGALELATCGVFCPGNKVGANAATVTRRDNAIACTTFATNHDCVDLLTRLRKKFGVHCEGKVVVAVSVRRTSVV